MVIDIMVRMNMTCVWIMDGTSGGGLLTRIASWYRVVKKKVFHKSEEKVHKKLKMTLQRAKNLVHVKQHYCVSYCKKIYLADMAI